MKKYLKIFFISFLYLFFSKKSFAYFPTISIKNANLSYNKDIYEIKIFTPQFTDITVQIQKYKNSQVYIYKAIKQQNSFIAKIDLSIISGKKQKITFYQNGLPKIEYFKNPYLTNTGWYKITIVASDSNNTKNFTYYSFIKEDKYAKITKSYIQNIFSYPLNSSNSSLSLTVPKTSDPTQRNNELINKLPIDTRNISNIYYTDINGDSFKIFKIGTKLYNKKAYVFCLDKTQTNFIKTPYKQTNHYIIIKPLQKGTNTCVILFKNI